MLDEHPHFLAWKASVQVSKRRVPGTLWAFSNSSGSGIFRCILRSLGAAMPAIQTWSMEALSWLSEDE